MICKLFRRLENTQRIFVLSLFNLHLCLFDLTMKRHHEDKNPYNSADSHEIDSINHSLPKRFATRNNSQSKNEIVNVNYSPPNSIGSDSSSSSSTTSSCSVNLSHQLCTCPNSDCVVHLSTNRDRLPIELSQQTNPIYANTNLLLHYAHLERCRRYGTDFHLNTSST